MLDDYFKDVVILNNHVITDEIFNKLKDSGFVVDGIDGGLLLGASHGDLGIEHYTGEGILVVTIRNGQYVICNEFEGYEYLLNPGAACDGGFNQESLNITDDLKDFQEYIPTSSISTLDLRLQNAGKIKSKLLFLNNADRYSLTNKGSTMKRLKLLDDQNKKWEGHNL